MGEITGDNKRSSKIGCRCHIRAKISYFYEKFLKIVGNSQGMQASSVIVFAFGGSCVSRD